MKQWYEHLPALREELHRFFHNDACLGEDCPLLAQDGVVHRIEDIVSDWMAQGMSH